MSHPNPVIEAIMSRRSIRSFTDEPVSREQLETLLDAAMAAPSARNGRPWHFVIVQEPATRQAISGAYRFKDVIAHAPAAIVVCADNSGMFWIHDSCAATQNILLAAHALGLGAVWLELQPDEDRQQAVRDVVGLPPNMGVLCVVAVGHPAEAKPAHGPHDPARAHWERF